MKVAPAEPETLLAPGTEGKRTLPLPSEWPTPGT